MIREIVRQCHIIIYLKLLAQKSLVNIKTSTSFCETCEFSVFLAAYKLCVRIPDNIFAQQKRLSNSFNGNTLLCTAMSYKSTLVYVYPDVNIAFFNIWKILGCNSTPVIPVFQQNKK